MTPSEPSASTLWTQILEVIQNGTGEAAERALGQFCEHYRPLLVSFFAQRGWRPEQAEDFAHDFLLGRVVEGMGERRGFIHRAQRGQPGSFRSFLASVLWHFHYDCLKSMLAKKREGAAVHVPMDEVEFSRLGEATPDNVLRETDLAVARKVLDDAVGQSARSPVLLDYLCQRITLGEGAARLSLSEGAFKVAVHRLLQRLRANLRTEVARLVGPDEREIAEELKYLLGLLGHSDV